MEKLLGFRYIFLKVFVVKIHDDHNFILPRSEFKELTMFKLKKSTFEYTGLLYYIWIGVGNHPKNKKKTENKKSASTLGITQKRMEKSIVTIIE